MEAVFALADRVSVLVYGRIIATDTPDGVRNNRKCVPPIWERLYGELLQVRASLRWLRRQQCTTVRC